MPVEYVRVRGRDTGHEYSVPKDAVRPAAHEVLESREAASKAGKPLPAKPRVRVDGKPARKSQEEGVK